MASEKTIHLAVVSPSKSVFEGEVEGIQLPASEGMLGVLPGHAPMLALLGHGKVSIHTEDGETDYFVSGGFFEVKNNRVTVLADSVETIAELNAEEARQNFETILSETVTGDEIEDHLERLQAARIRANLASSK